MKKIVFQIKFLGSFDKIVFYIKQNLMTIQKCVMFNFKIEFEEC